MSIPSPPTRPPTLPLLLPALDLEMAIAILHQPAPHGGGLLRDKLHPLELTDVPARCLPVDSVVATVETTHTEQYQTGTCHREHRLEAVTLLHGVDLPRWRRDSSHNGLHRVGQQMPVHCSTARASSSAVLPPQTVGQLPIDPSQHRLPGVQHTRRAAVRSGRSSRPTHPIPPDISVICGACDTLHTAYGGSPPDILDIQDDQ
jgi:hypothetical protein